MKKIPNIPDAFNELPDTANIGSRDMIKIFNYKTIECLNASYVNKIIPDPDFRLKTGKGSQFERLFWKLGTIRKWRELAIAESNKQ